MAKKKKQYSESRLEKALVRVSRKYHPDMILAVLSKIYDAYSVASATEAEIEYWSKCSAATRNLSSGTQKWLYEMLDEIDEETNEED